MQSTFLSAQREHLGRSPLHFVLLRRQLWQDLYVRILRSDADDERCDWAVPSSATQSSCSLSQFRQPFSLRPSHRTFGDKSVSKTPQDSVWPRLSSHLSGSTRSTAHDVSRPRKLTEDVNSWHEMSRNVARGAEPSHLYQAWPYQRWRHCGTS